MRKRYLYIILMALILITLFKSLNSTSQLISATSSNITLTSINEMESIIQYGEDSVISIHYPVFTQEKVNEEITRFIHSYFEDFKELVKDFSAEDPNYKSELSIDYEIYKVRDNIVSLKFMIMENLPYYAHPNILVETKVFDLKKDNRLYLKDIMAKDYLEKISHYTINYFQNQEIYQHYVEKEQFYYGTLPLMDNYSNFILKDDSIVFIFNKYKLFHGSLGITSMEIPYIELAEYLRFDFTPTVPSIYIVEEEIVDNEKIEIIESRTIDPSRPMVALTFDDGPYSKVTIPILNTLKEHNVVATFFVLGNRVPNNKDIIKRMVAEGNEIGNHSFNHKQLTTLSSKELKEQIVRTQQSVLEIIGSEPKIMRPTYGSYNNRLKSEVKMPMILWSIDTLDWKEPPIERIVNHVLDNVRDGDIVLMHDLYLGTAQAVEEIVPGIINRGFQLVTISELYELQGEALEVGNIYNRLPRKK